MCKTTVSMLLIAGMLIISPGCETPGGSGPSATLTQAPARQAFTAENNPTTIAGRGEPDLDDPKRPAAWILIDGKEGHFTERSGEAQLQWIIDRPVCPTPTFRVEVYKPLLGSPTDFDFVLRGKPADGGQVVLYTIRSEGGAASVGKQYSLLKPGKDFVIYKSSHKEPVGKIPPLAPGAYRLIASIRNGDTGKQGLAVTSFTVSKVQ